MCLEDIESGDEGHYEAHCKLNTIGGGAWGSGVDILSLVGPITPAHDGAGSIDWVWA